MYGDFGDHSAVSTTALKVKFTKDQLISKGLFGFFNSPKKQTKYFCPSRLEQKLAFSSSFFGRIEEGKTLKFPFEIN